MSNQPGHSHVAEYLKKNKIQVKLSIYCSGMSEYVVNMYRVLPASIEPDDKKRGELLADARGDTLEEALSVLDLTCQHLLEVDRIRETKPWKKSVL